MQLSQIPTQVPLPFAANGTKNAIPEASQIGVTPGAASLNDGFPPLTFTPLAAGGVPPSGADFNGILNLLSQNTQWQNAGGFFPYSASFSTAIGGYPKTALLAKASGLGFWLNLVDNNTTDPDTGGAGWIAFDPWAIQAAQYITAPDTGAVNAYAVALTPTPTALTPGMLVSIKSISNTNTGAATLAVNGLSTLPILLAKNTPLSGGELTAGYGAIVKLNNAGTAWELIWTGAGSFGIAATQSNANVTLGQMTDGSLSPTFAETVVAPATRNNAAVQLGQFSIGQQSFVNIASPAASTNYQVAGTFTAPGVGKVSLKGYVAQPGSAGFEISCAMNGNTTGAINGYYAGTTMFGDMNVTSGEVVTWAINAVSSSASSQEELNIFGELLFSPN